MAQDASGPSQEQLHATTPSRLNGHRQDPSMTLPASATSIPSWTSARRFVICGRSKAGSWRRYKGGAPIRADEKWNLSAHSPDPDAPHPPGRPAELAERSAALEVVSPGPCEVPSAPPR